MYYALVTNNEVERVLYSAQNITINGTDYSYQIFASWSVDDLIAIGIYPYTDVTEDSRYYTHGTVSYTINAKDVVGTFPGIAISVADLQARLGNDINNAVSQQQGAIDWYWNRASKGGKAVPANIQTYATTLYSEQATKETEVAALTTLAEVVAYELNTLNVWTVNPTAVEPI